MLRVAVPNKGALAGAAAEMLSEAGYRTRHDRELTTLDPRGGVEFFYLRPKDIPVYVGSGDVDLGIAGRDYALESGAPVEELLALACGRAVLRYAAPFDQEWSPKDLAGKRIATSFHRLVSEDLARLDVQAQIVELDGAVEISIQLGVADVIADLVETGRSLRLNNLAAFGEPLCVSEATIIGRAERETSKAQTQFVTRMRGVVLAQQYMMLDYDCPREVLDTAISITPGLESPTVAPLADANWAAVRALVPRAEVNRIMDELAETGARAILASDLRTCRL